jgi:hypothetical protein
MYVAHKVFDKLMEADPLLAASVWDRNVPAFMPRPAGLPELEKEPETVNTIEPGRRRKKAVAEPYLDASGGIGAAAQSAGRQAQAQEKTVDGIGPDPDAKPSPGPAAASPRPEDPKAERTRMLLEGLERQYLKADDKYHFRDLGREVAFEAQDKKLVTSHDEPTVVASMIDLAEAKGWSSLKLKGTNEFRQEAWLQASVRDFEVTGYKPNAFDKARLEALRAERQTSNRSNVMADVAPPPDGVAKSREKGFGPLKASDAHEPPLALTKPQDQAVGAMEVMMRSRGDSERGIAMARAELTERLRSDRVYVGKLMETGTAP